MEESKSTPNKQLIIGIVLGIVLLGLAGFTIYQNSILSSSNAYLEEEKVRMTSQIDEQIAELEAAQAQNSSLSEELEAEKQSLMLLRDSISELQSDFKSMQRYKGWYYSQKKKNEKLLALNDSLSKYNETLSKSLDSVNTVVEGQNVVLDSLNVQNTALNDKVGLGSQLKIAGLKTMSLKRKGSGKLVETTKATKTDAVKVSFTIAENVIAEKGERSALIQVTNPLGEVVRVLGSTVLTDGSEVDYSGETPVDYDNANVEVITLIDVDKKSNKPGKYTINVYLEDRLVGSGSVTLK